MATHQKNIPLELTLAGASRGGFRQRVFAPLLYRGLGLKYLPEQLIRQLKGRRRIAFVAPWFGEGISGGAEAECRRLALELSERVSNLEVHVITTCLKEFSADWNVNVHLPGVSRDHGVTVHRCPVPQMDRSAFGALNMDLLMGQELESLMVSDPPRSPLSAEEERVYLDSNVTCPEMLHYLRRHYHYFDAFVFMPYLFSPALEGSLVVAGKAHVIPCLHEERYALLQATQKMMASVESVLFHVPAEKAFAERCYVMKVSHMIGEMVDTDVLAGDAVRFRKTFGIDDPFVLFTGRVIESKGVPDLVRAFRRFRGKRLLSKLKLVILGKGDLDYGGLEEEGIYALGFVSEQEKMDAYAAAHVFCMPSLFESFSISLMEAWLQNTPVLVPQCCAVTRDHVEGCSGGWVYSSEDELIDHLEQVEGFSAEGLQEAGGLGRDYVLQNFTPERIVFNVVSALFGKCFARKGGV